MIVLSTAVDKSNINFIVIEQDLIIVLCGTFTIFRIWFSNCVTKFTSEHICMYTNLTVSKNA